MGQQTLLLMLGMIIGAMPVMAQNPDRTTRQLCQELTEYQSDGSVDYKPDEDVRGRHVAPADLDGVAKIELPEEVWFRITVDQAQFLGVPYETMPFNAQADIGTVRISLKNGDVYYDGKRISQPRVQVLCSDVLKNDQAKKAQKNTAPKRDILRRPKSPIHQ